MGLGRNIDPTDLSSWKRVTVCTEGEPVDLNGVNPWEHEWKQMHDITPQPAPSTNYLFRVWRIDTEGRTVIFGAGEVSANVWAFYLPVGRAV